MFLSLLCEYTTLCLSVLANLLTDKFFGFCQFFPVKYSAVVDVLVYVSFYTHVWLSLGVYLGLRDVHHLTLLDIARLLSKVKVAVQEFSFSSIQYLSLGF